MTRIIESTNGRTPFERLLGHNPKIMQLWGELSTHMEQKGCLSSELKEQVRRTLAQGNGCEYCKAKGKPDALSFDEQTTVAAGFAEVFLIQKGKIGDAQFDVLKSYFSDGEISELIAFITFTTASQYYGSLMQLSSEDLKAIKDYV